MKPNSISGFTCYAQDLDETAEFYAALGFRAGKREDDRVTYYINWFSITFLARTSKEKSVFRDEAESEVKGTGVFFNIKVDDIVEFYRGMLDAGIKPLTEPQELANGSREFVVADPDGYKLAFFQKK